MPLAPLGTELSWAEAEADVMHTHSFHVYKPIFNITVYFRERL